MKLISCLISAALLVAATSFAMECGEGEDSYIPIYTNGGAYIQPNENEPFHMKTTLENKKGALMIVGSFRALINFGLGRFKHLYYWEDDNQWSRIKDILIKDNFLIQLGDISNKTDMVKINNYLNQKNTKIAVIDLSNVPDYIKKKNFEFFNNSIMSLGRQNDSVLLFTGGNVANKSIVKLGTEKNGMGWNYYSLSLESLDELKDFVGEIDS